MTTVTFDTLKYAEALKTAGVPDAQAKAQAEALADALRPSGQDLPTATDADIAEFRMFDQGRHRRSDVRNHQAPD